MLGGVRGIPNISPFSFIRKFVRDLSVFFHRGNCLLVTMIGIITGTLGCSAK
jgi:hypothetical protein